MDTMDIPPEFEADIQRVRELPDQQDQQTLLQLIQVLEEILGRLEPETYPLFYARTQYNLGDAYRELPKDDQGINLERAIACYQEALRFYTPEVAPLLYSRTQYYLGYIYDGLQTGDRATNLERAIACYQEFLRFYTPEVAPPLYAKVQYALGVVYWKLTTGDRTANLEQAIVCYQEALRFRTLEAEPFGYSLTQYNLGNAYYDLPTGDQKFNLERAMACYQEALRYWTPETAPMEYASTQRMLGHTYYKLPTDDRAANLERAMACYQEALRFQMPETNPFDYAELQSLLGGAYFDLPTGDQKFNLERAIACYQEALRYWTPETAPMEYARIQNNLGMIYNNPPMGTHVDNMRRAIACYQEALRFRTPETHPFEYAMTQSYLGALYSTLPTGDRSANLEQAKACLQEALRFLTPEDTPLECGRILNNLGMIYFQRPTGDRKANLLQAIRYYQEAMRLSTTKNYDEWSTTLRNLIAAYLDPSIGLKPEETIPFYLEALRQQQPETNSLKYALIQYSLGMAYFERSDGDRKANLEQAITCFQEALRLLDPEIHPFEYATIQTGMGIAYWKLPTGEEDQETNLKRAAACYQEALRFQPPETAPAGYRKTNLLLGLLYSQKGEWRAALNVYRAAIKVGEQLYLASLSNENKAAEMTANATLYRETAFAAARCEETDEALSLLEQGKTRLLGEALRTHLSRPANVPDEAWIAFEQAVNTLRTIQLESAAFKPLQTYTGREQAAKDAFASLNVAIEHIRAYAPSFLQEKDFRTFHALLPDQQTVLIAFCFTNEGSMGFVVDRSHQKVQVVEVPKFTRDDLLNLFIGKATESGAIGGWLEAYSRYRRELNSVTFKAWQESITTTLQELSQRLLVPILSTLPSRIRRIIFLPSLELLLFPLHAAPLSNNDHDLICDRYQVSYAPSIEVLSNVQAKALQTVTPNLYTVINPQSDPQLFFTPVEGAAIASLFAQSNVDEAAEGTKQHVIARMSECSYLHFSCHGVYERNDPAQSGLILTDGRLTLGEMQQGKIDLSNIRLVTLSACETGIIHTFQRGAEEYVGLPAGFMMAGVPCVVSSLWAVPDLSTALLMERFYLNHLRSGMDFTAALCEAQKWVRELKIGEVAEYAALCYRQSKQREKEKKELLKFVLHYHYLTEQNPSLHPFAHPYYWAAFTVNGW